MRFPPVPAQTPSCLATVGRDRSNSQMVPVAHTGGRIQSLGEGVKSYFQMERSRLWIVLVPFSRRTTLFPDPIGSPFWHNGTSTLARMLACLSPDCVTEIKLRMICLSVTYDSVVLSAGNV